MLLSVVVSEKGGSTVSWFEFVAGELGNPDEVEMVVVVVVTCVVELDVGKVVGSAGNYNDWC